MYTRIKNQKSGIKLLTNASTRASRVMPLAATTATVPAPTTGSSCCASSTSSSSSASNAGDSPSSTSLSSTTIQNSSSSSFDLAAVDFGGIMLLQQQQKQQQQQQSLAVDSEQSRIPFENSFNSMNKPGNNSKNGTAKATPSSQKYTKNKKPNNYSSEMNTVDDIGGDINCILYVKSTWEKYASEIGTEKGPLRHVIDENSEYPHLNGFVAFDLEHWWAERALVSSIGERSSTMSSPSSTTSSSTSSSLSSSSNNPSSSQQNTMTTTASLGAALKINPSALQNHHHHHYATASPFSNLNNFTIGFT